MPPSPTTPSRRSRHRPMIPSVVAHEVARALRDFLAQQENLVKGPYLPSRCRPSSRPKAASRSRKCRSASRRTAIDQGRRLAKVIQRHARLARQGERRPVRRRAREGATHHDGAGASGHRSETLRERRRRVSVTPRERREREALGAAEVDPQAQVGVEQPVLDVACAYAPRYGLCLQLDAS